MILETQQKKLSEVPIVLRRYNALLFLLWLLAVAVLLCDRFLFRKSEFYWYPFFAPNIAGTDFSIFLSRFRYFHSSLFFTSPGYPFTYPAPVAFIIAAFTHSIHPTALFVGTCVIGYVASAGLLFRSISTIGFRASSVLWILLPTALLGYPEWFLLNRGNVEAFCWFAIALGLWAYWHERWYAAAILLGLAAALKLFPFMLLALLLPVKRYLAFALGIVVLVGTTVLSTWLIGPTYSEASRGVAAGLEYFRQQYALTFGSTAIGYDHSLFVWVKLAFYKHSYDRPLNVYLPVCAVCGLLLYWFRIRVLPRANQIVALLTCMVLLPPVSFEYTLIHLYVAWAVLVFIALAWHRTGKAAPAGLLPAFVALGLLLSMENYLIFMVRGVHFRVAGPLKSLVLLVLLLIALRKPWPDADPELISGL